MGEVGEAQTHAQIFPEKVHIWMSNSVYPAHEDTRFPVLSLHARVFPRAGSLWNTWLPRQGVWPCGCGTVALNRRARREQLGEVSPPVPMATVWRRRATLPTANVDLPIGSTICGCLARRCAG